jgi:hypothetical protein
MCIMRFVAAWQYQFVATFMLQTLWWRLRIMMLAALHVTSDSTGRRGTCAARM